VGAPQDGERTVSLWGATSIVVASMIGTGVYASLGFQIAEIPSGFAILAVWGLGGLIALCGALCYAELVACFPRSGGEYHLLGAVYDPFVGFLAGWVSITAGFAAPIALAAMAFGAYLAPVLGGVSEGGLAIGLVVAMTGMALLRIQIGSRVLIALTGLKVATLLLVIGAAGVMNDPQPVNVVPGASDLKLLFSGPFAISLVYVMYAFSGWNASVYVVNEVRDPRRTVPLSLLLGTGLVTLLYVGTQAAFLRAAPMASLSGRVEVGLIAGRVLFGRAGGDLLALLICLGLVSMVGAMVWSGSRVGQMIGQDYPRLRALARISSGGSPWVSVVLQSAVVLVLLTTSSFASVAVYLQGVLILSSMLTVLGVFRLWRLQPDRPRGGVLGRHAAAPLIFGAMSAFMLVHVVRERPVETAWGAVTLLAGGAAYVWARPRKLGSPSP
jgi:APA family basic amino acid/polyamine antiporter